MRLPVKRIHRIARRAPFAHVAIATRGGPHVTPVLYALTSDRLWLLVQRSTLKARVLARRPEVGVLLDGGEESVSVRGRATVIDPLRPHKLVMQAPELARAPFGMQSYVTSNVNELIAFPGDMGLQIPQPAIISVRPDEVTFLSRSEGPAAAEAAVLGWLAEDGPRALPALWEAGASTAYVAADPGALDDEAPACVCVDVSRGRGPASKAGVMWRGQGRADGGRVELAVERITRWDGFETQTEPVGLASPACLAR